MATAATPARRARGPLAAFRNLRTAAKLLVGFLLVGALGVGVGLFGLSSLAGSQQRMEGLSADELLPIRTLGEIDGNLQEARQLILSLAVAHPEDRAAILSDIRANDAETDDF